METVQTQYVAVQSAHDRVKALRNAANSETGDDRSNTASTSY
jgi:hypothetical protein